MTLKGKSKAQLASFIEAREEELERTLLRADELRADIEQAKMALKYRRSTRQLRFERVRDAARKLGEFTISELAYEADISTSSARNYLKKLVEAEIVGDPSHYRQVGTGRPSPVYEYIKPTDAGPQNPHRKVESPSRRGGSPVHLDRRPKIADAEMDKLIEAAYKQGFRIKRDAKNHVRIFGRDNSVVSIPSTPSSSRTYKNKKAQLRSLGIKI